MAIPLLTCSEEHREVFSHLKYKSDFSLMKVFSRLSISTRNLTGQEALERFVSCLYNELFGVVVGLINRFLDRNSTPSLASITIVDYPGSNFTFHNEVSFTIS